LQLADSRVQHLKDQGYRDAVIRLIKEPDANSDDKLDPNAPPGVVQYRIKAKPERSDLTTAFLRHEDQIRRMNQSVKSKGAQRYDLWSLFLSQLN